MSNNQRLETDPPYMDSYVNLNYIILSSANILINQYRTSDEIWPSCLRGWARGSKLQTVKYQNVIKCCTVPRCAIKMDFNFVDWRCLAWMAQGTDNWQVFLNTVMNFRVL